MKKLILLIIILISGIAFGQKAIEINGKITIYNKLPKEWNDISGIKIVNFNNAVTESELYDLGFRNVVYPNLSSYQRRGNIYMDIPNDYFTYPVIDFIQVQIDNYDQQQLDNDASALKIQSYKSDGQIAHKRIWDRIIRKFDNGDITNTQFKNISNILFDAILPIEFGLWYVAKAKVDALTPPSNAEMLAILDKVKEIINNYITENY